MLNLPLAVTLLALAVAALAALAALAAPALLRRRRGRVTERLDQLADR